MCLYFLCNSVIYSSSFSLSCSPQATKPKYCLDRSYMLSLFSDPVSLYMCNNSRNGAILSGSLIFRSPLRFLTFSISYYHFTRIFSEILQTKRQTYSISYFLKNKKYSLSVHPISCTRISYLVLW